MNHGNTTAFYTWQSSLWSYIENCKSEIKALSNTFSQTERNINTTLDKIVYYEDRLNAVENKAKLSEDKIAVLEEMVAKLMDENRELLAYKTRPKPFLYPRTIVVFNIQKHEAEGQENTAPEIRLQLAIDILAYGLKLNPVPV